jgi:hypothetical protein
VGLQYKSRGDRHEGIKPKPVAGYDIELISVLVDYQEKVEHMPDRLKVRWFLNESSSVHVVVRELDYSYYYWLDKIRPARPWQLGFDNVFEWPTRDVLQQLSRMKVHDLGVTVRLGNVQPSQKEHVAPVILYHSRVPETVEGYLFTFKTSGSARLSCSIYAHGQNQPLFTKAFRRIRGGRPFTVKWDAKDVSGGSYRLIVRGYSLDSNAPIAQTVFFHHQPKVR